MSLAPNGEVGTGTHDIPGSILAEIASGTKHLYVWGIANYRSVFNESGEHVTKFCAKAENLSGNPAKAWDPKLPFNIDFTAINRHNYADEDGGTKL